MDSIDKISPREISVTHPCADNDDLFAEARRLVPDRILKRMISRVDVQGGHIFGIVAGFETIPQGFAYRLADKGPSIPVVRRQGVR